MNSSRNNEFTEKQIRGIDLVIKSAKKKYPFIRGWEFHKNFKDYVAHLYINLIVDFDEVAEFYKDTLSPFYKERKMPLISSLLLTFLSSNYNSIFDSPERQESFNRNYNETRKVTNFIENLYKNLPEDFLIYYDLDKWDGSRGQLLVTLAVSDFYDITAV
jgi:hypothetical protein